MVLEDRDERRLVQSGDSGGRKLGESFVGRKEDRKAGETLKRSNHSDGVESSGSSASILSGEFSDGGRKVDN